MLEVATVPQFLARLKHLFAQTVLARWRGLNAPILERLIDEQGRTRFWQRGGGYDRNLFSDAEVTEKVQYIENNPVRAGLVNIPSEYRWSSAHTRGAR
jgi:putative transposase